MYTYIYIYIWIYGNICRIGLPSVLITYFHIMEEDKASASGRLGQSTRGGLMDRSRSVAEARSIESRFRYNPEAQRRYASERPGELNPYAGPILPSGFVFTGGRRL